MERTTGIEEVALAMGAGRESVMIMASPSAHRSNFRRPFSVVRSPRGHISSALEGATTMPLPLIATLAGAVIGSAAKAGG